MKVPTNVIDLVANHGRGYILLPGNRVRVWRAFQWGAHECFSGQRAWDLMAPNGTEFVMQINEGDPHPIIWRKDEPA